MGTTAGIGNGQESGGADELRMLREARDAAEQAVRERDLLIAHLAHELRAPLNAVVGGAASLLETPLDAAQRETASGIRAGACAVASVAGALLDYTRIETGGLVLDACVVDVRQAVRGAIAIVSAAARAQGVTVTCQVGAGVPSSVLADGGRLTQVLVNLAGNAIKFAPRGHVDVRVEGHARGDDVELHFAVRDDGVGIAPEDHARLFRAFSQLEAGRARGGTGLGLAISKCLCELMGGRIWAESAPGAGSTFHFTIAVRATAEETADAPAQAARLDVLVVDDDAASRAIVAARVERLGHRVRTAADGMHAVRACWRRPHDVVLMDIEMPGMDGLEAARRITLASRRRQRPRIVALTGHGGADVRARLMAAGFDDHLCKPVDDSALARVLERRAVARPASAASHDASIDREHLEDLRSLAPDGALLAEVVGHFLQEAARVPGALLEDAARGDAARVAERSHRARSVALASGATGVAQACRALEECAASRSLWRVPVLVERLQAEIESARTALAPHARAA